MAHLYRLGLVTCHHGCAYTVLQTVQRHGVYSVAYGTVHYKEPLKSFEIRVGIVPASDFLLLRYCHDCAESDVKQYSHSHPIEKQIDANLLKVNIFFLTDNV